MANKTTHVIRGELHWAKVIGQPRLNTFTEEREWSVDVTPNDEGRKELKRIGIADRLKEPKENDTRKETFISFRQKEFRTNAKTGEKTPNRPIKVVDAQGKDWPQDMLIGNGSVADVKFTVHDNGRGRPKGVYIQAIRVLDHVPFESQEFAPLSSDDEYFASSSTVEDKPSSKSPSDNLDDLDDDIPF